MRGRYFLFFLSILALAWIGYVSWDFLTRKDLFRLEELFGKEDEAVLIINRPAEFNAALVDFQTDNPVYELVLSMLPNQQEKTSICISRARPHFHITGRSVWDEAAVRLAFAGHPLTFISANKFRFDGYTGLIKKNVVYVFREELKTSVIATEWSNFDLKSSATLVDFSRQKPVLTEIYFGDGGTSEYITRTQKPAGTGAFDDKALFAMVLPDGLSDYHFTEKFTLAEQDSVYKNSPLFSWVDKGLVEFTYKGVPVLLTDYLSGQQPGLILRDIQPDTEYEAEDYYTATSLKEDLSFDPAQGFFMKEIEDYVLICKSKDVIDQVIGDYKLGKTVALNPAKAESIYGNLPAVVSERFVNGSQRTTRTFYDDHLFEIRFAENGNGPAQTPGGNTDAYKFPADGLVQDFVVFDEPGKVALLNDKNQLIYFQDGNRKWVYPLPAEEKLLGMELVDLFNNDKLQVLLTTDKSIYLVDVLGRDVGEFPAKADQQFNAKTTFYRWKDQGYFVNSEQNRITLLDARGRELNQVRTSLGTIRQPVEVWLSNNILFFGATDHQKFSMIQAEKSREYRTFDLKGPFVAMTAPNQVFLYTIENQVLMQTDQKGTRTQLASFPGGHLAGKTSTGNLPVLLVKQGNSYKLLNTKGIEFRKITVPFSETDDLAVGERNGRIEYAIADGLENNVYLYGADNRKMNVGAMEGMQKTQLTYSGKKRLVTTIIENFVIQYLR